MPAAIFTVDFEGYWRDRNTRGIPSQSGAYCVYECTYSAETDTVTIRTLIYIGEAGNVRQRIVGHERREEWNRYVRTGNELCFSFGYVEPGVRPRVEAALIFRHRPPANYELTESFPYDTTAIIARGKTALLSTHFTVERSG